MVRSLTFESITFESRKALVFSGQEKLSQGTLFERTGPPWLPAGRVVLPAPVLPAQVLAAP